MLCVYRYKDIDNDYIIEYIGEVHGKKQTLKARIQSHAAELRFMGRRWLIEYQDDNLYSTTDVKALESHYISLYNPSFNKAKVNHGLCSFIPKEFNNGEWKVYGIEDYSERKINNDCEHKSYARITKRFDSLGRELYAGEYQAQDGRYLYQYEENGKKKRLYSWRLIESDVAPYHKKSPKCLREMIEELRKQDFSYLTLDSFFDMYAETKVGKIKESTLNNYIYSYQHFIQPVFGDKRVSTISAKMVQDFYKKLIEESNIKTTTLEPIHQLLFRTFEIAIDKGVIQINPCRNLISNYRPYGRRKSKAQQQLSIVA